jgi:hypothetical protein
LFTLTRAAEKEINPQHKLSRARFSKVKGHLSTDSDVGAGKAEVGFADANKNKSRKVMIMNNKY